MMSTIFILLLLFFTIYNYTVPIGDGNDTIIMHYDEPIDQQEQQQEDEDEDEDEEDKND